MKPLPSRAGSCGWPISFSTRFSVVSFLRSAGLLAPSRVPYLLSNCPIWTGWLLTPCGVGFRCPAGSALAEPANVCRSGSLDFRKIRESRFLAGWWQSATKSEHYLQTLEAGCFKRSAADRGRGIERSSWRHRRWRARRSRRVGFRVGVDLLPGRVIPYLGGFRKGAPQGLHLYRWLWPGTTL